MDAAINRIKTAAIAEATANNINTGVAPDNADVVTATFGSFLDMKRYLSRVDTHFVLLHLGDVGLIEADVPSFRFNVGQVAYDVQCLWFPIQPVNGLTPPCGMMAVISLAGFCTYLKGIFYKPEVMVIAAPGARFGRLLMRGHPTGGGEAVFKAPKIIMQGGDDDIMRWLETENLPMEDKTRAVLYNLYAYLREELAVDGVVLGYTDAVAAKGLVAVGPPAGSSEEKSKKFVWGTTLALLAPFYSQAGELSRQVHRRGRAAAQKAGYDWGEFNHFEAYKTTMHVDIIDRSADLDRDLGRWLARDNNLRYEPSVTIPNLISLQHLRDNGLAEEWPIALLEQGRLVGAKAHATTLSFAIAAEELGRNLCTEMGGEWDAEAALLQLLAVRSHTQPFCGLVYELPDEQRVASWPRLAYIGVLYYHACLPKAQADKFANTYQIDGIRSHVPDDATKSSCEAVASILPVKSIVGVGNLLKQI
jgi:hypothetical protein